MNSYRVCTKVKIGIEVPEEVVEFGGGSGVILSGFMLEDMFEQGFYELQMFDQLKRFVCELLFSMWRLKDGRESFRATSASMKDDCGTCLLEVEGWFGFSVNGDLSGEETGGIIDDYDFIGRNATEDYQPLSLIYNSDTETFLRDSGIKDRERIVSMKMISDEIKVRAI